MPTWTRGPLREVLPLRPGRRPYRDGGFPRMTTEERNVECPCCGGQHAYVLDLLAELDAAKAREAKLRELLRQTSECLHDIATERGGWAWEEVLDEARAALAETEDRNG